MTAANESTHLLPTSTNGGRDLTIRFGGALEDNVNTRSNGSGLDRRAMFSVKSLSKRLSKLYEEHTGSIGMLGSISIAVNSLTGPAMLNLPAIFARSGLIPTTFTLIFVCILTTFCSLHMANSISKVPNNADFKKEVEYSQVFAVFWGQGWFLFTQVIFFGCISCLNISSIVDTSQVVDTFFGHWLPHGGTAALQIVSWHQRPNWIRWDYGICTQDELLLGDCIPFQGVDGILLTAGNLATTCVFFPLALMDLKENAAWQVVAFIILLVVSLQFTIQFATWPGVRAGNLSWWGTDWRDLLGVVLFNFAVVIVVPAWLYEREPHVHVPTVISSSSVLSTILYMAIGALGCLAMPNVSDNMLESMMSGAWGVFMQLGASIFAFAIIGLGIPLFSVLTRLNLTGSGLCSQRVGNVLAVYLPFVAAWLLSSSGSVTSLLSWGGVIFTSLIAFIFPLVLAIHVTQKTDAEGSIEVYGRFWKSKRAQLCSLRVLLVLTVLAVIAAVGGLLLE